MFLPIAFQPIDPNTGMPVELNAPQSVATDPVTGAPIVEGAAPMEGEMPADEAMYDDGYDPNAYAQFEGALSPYGSWYDDPTYGRVWAPTDTVVGSDFAPYYSNGHWVLTEYGWTWVSEYAWGWAPFHYGRWVSVATRGWCWIPGTVWGPAWVGWRSGGGYAGWAPLPPRGMPYGGRGFVGSPWRACPAAQLGAAHPAFVPGGAMPGILRGTTACNTPRVMNLNEHVVRITAGPVALATGANANVAFLRTVAPSALPRYAVAPQVGTPMGARPWVRSFGTAGGMPNQGYGYRAPVTFPANNNNNNNAFRAAAPFTGGYAPGNPGGAPVYGGYRPPVYATPAGAPVYRPAPSYAAPTYRPVMPSYAPVYRPAPTFAQPVYRPAPSYGSPSFAQPVYRPAPSYAAPAYRAPSYSAPSYSAPAFHPAQSFGGGGGGMRFGGGGGFGGRRR